uniref:Uncharacterized protein n=1 Tax=Anguilla anguilla TaxID=7936 RepID=A0A0E9SLL4_ANGAN
MPSLCPVKRLYLGRWQLSFATFQPPT